MKTAIKSFLTFPYKIKRVTPSSQAARTGSESEAQNNWKKGENTKEKPKVKKCIQQINKSSMGPENPM